MNSDKFITVIPVEYPRPTRLYPQPPHQYSDFTEEISADSLNNDVQQSRNSANNIKQDQRYINSEIIPDVDQTSTSKGSDFESQTNNAKSLHVCVYLMNNVILHMELEDGANTTVSELIDAIVHLEQLSLPPISSNIFTLWMSSGLLELQLKRNHKPLLIRSRWSNLLSRFAHASISRQEKDEPILSFQRNVFYSLAEEDKIIDAKILELLYEEAKYNILEGRYPCELSQCILLGSIQARLEMGPYNPQFHTNNFFRTHKHRFLPYHVRHDNLTSWFGLRMKNSPEVKLLEHFKRIPNNATDKKLQRRYLEVCWCLPYYGSSFFQGQIEEPVRGLTTLLLHQDMPVLVGINEHGVYVIDNIQSKLLIGLKYEEFSWELANPCSVNNTDCLPCIFLQFMVIENSARVSKIMQIFSKQAVMMDALINSFVEQIKAKLNTHSMDEVDSNVGTSTQNSCLADSKTTRLANKLNKLTLATFDDQGQCIGQMGSLQFEY